MLIVTSPHQVMYADYFHISPGRGATGDMSAFGAAQTKLTVEYDAPLRDEIIRCGEAVGLQVGTLGQRDPYLDHGTFEPLYFLREAGVDCPILRIGLSGFSPLDHYRLGQCIAQAVESLDRREGPEFDRQITEAMAAGVCCCPTWRVWTRWSGKSTSPARRAASAPGRSFLWSALRWCGIHDLRAVFSPL